MKTYRDEPFSVAPIPWKPGQWAIYLNQKDNGEQQEESIPRYEADFTIIDSLSLAAVEFATKRMVQDPELDDKVIFSIEVAGVPAIEIRKEYPLPVDLSLFRELAAGVVAEHEIFRYGGKLLMAKKDFMYDGGVPSIDNFEITE